MRSIRGLLTVLALLALVPQVVAAQEGRSFRNAWFWGAKLGGMTYDTRTQSNQVSPTAGLDWLITRTRGGVYLSYSQGLLNANEQLFVWPGGGDTLYVLPDEGVDTLPATLRNTRRFDALGMLFPQFSVLGVRPMFGIGLSFLQVASAGYDPSRYNVNQQYFLEEEVKRVRTNVSPMLMAGLQASLMRFSVYGQGSVITTRRDFLLKGRSPTSFAVEAGIRWNIGSSIERDFR